MMTLKFKKEKNVTIFFCCKKPNSGIFLKSRFKTRTRTSSHCNQSGTLWGLHTTDPSLHPTSSTCLLSVGKL